ncbi:MAG: chromate transporter [Betaproteobacteria bacterium]|nr:chromate transporter [Betaproteobacteria bacterium]
MLNWGDWFDLLSHFLSLSLISFGGALSTAPEMHRYLVEGQHWLDEQQFAGSIALAQAAPGPNVLFVALLGWHVGLNAGGLPAALSGALLAMLGILVPSTTLACLAANWVHANRGLRPVRAFKQGMAPVVVALIVATGWILAGAHASPEHGWSLWLLAAASALLAWRSGVHMLWLLGAGAVLGWFGAV